MTVVTELELPEIDYNMPGFGPETYHQLLGEARQRNWLAHSPLAYIVLDAESGDFFLRARQTTFPGRSSPSCSASPAARCTRTSRRTSSTSPATSTAGCGR
jgi:hypothetical protein